MLKNNNARAWWIANVASIGIFVLARLVWVGFSWRIMSLFTVCTLSTLLLWCFCAAPQRAWHINYSVFLRFQLTGCLLKQKDMPTWIFAYLLQIMLSLQYWTVRIAARPMCECFQWPVRCTAEQLREDDTVCSQRSLWCDLFTCDMFMKVVLCSRIQRHLKIWCTSFNSIWKNRRKYE